VVPESQLTIFVQSLFIERRNKMNRNRPLHQMFVLSVVVALLMVCNDVSAKSATIDDPQKPFSVDNFKLQITSVKLGSSMFAPAGMATDETVLTVEIKVLSGDPKIVAKSDGDFDVWTSDDTGKRNSSRAATSLVTGDGKILSIKWLFGVAKSSKSYYLYFPSGVKVNLSPFLP
jgi:hypothetical protein